LDFPQRRPGCSHRRVRLISLSAVFQQTIISLESGSYNPFILLVVGVVIALVVNGAYRETLMAWNML
jgi:hypothetical protein